MTKDHVMDTLREYNSIPVETLLVDVDIDGCSISRCRPKTGSQSAASKAMRVVGRCPLKEISVSEDSPVELARSSVSLRASVTVSRDCSFYGTGLTAGPLERSGRAVEFWNLDPWPYDEESPSLYQSHPYVLAVHQDGSAIGALADCLTRGRVITKKGTIVFEFAAEYYDLFIIRGVTPHRVQEGLARLIGTAPLPPLWALGYHQSRWSYMSDAEVLDVAFSFKRRGIPCDAIWLDIDHMDQFEVMSWEPLRFPKPQELLGRLHREGMRVVAIQGPGVAAVRDNRILRSGLDGEHFICTPGGRPYEGEVWPGICYFPDFTRERTRDWWASLVCDWALCGVDGVWNDMNEPSVFDTPSRTFEQPCEHRGHGGAPHEDFHNAYGTLMCQATQNGMKRAYPDRRPFVLTRSSCIGGAKYAGTWTGDNRATWRDLKWSISMVINLGLSGQPFAGPDIGGFDGSPSTELFVRWFELGAFLPFCRGHSQKDSPRREPWSHGAEAERHIRQALLQRMRLLPVFYTLFLEAERTGLPVVRPVFFADPSDPGLRTVDDAFLLGDGLLIAPIVEEGATKRRVRVPKGIWFRYPSGAPIEGGREIIVDAPLGQAPVLARGGTIVVEGTAAQHTDEVLCGDRLLRVFLDRTGSAYGEAFEDSGDGFEYRAGGGHRVRYEAQLHGGSLEIRARARGSFAPRPRRLEVVGHAMPPLSKALHYRGPESFPLTVD